MPTLLNDAQRSVIESQASRIVVSAGAGSGKTRTLVERFVDRVLRFEAEGLEDVMRRILLITFTEKAAGELVERVRARLLEEGRADLAREVDDSWISTILGSCNRIVRRHALELGVDPGFGVLSETDSGLARTEAFESAAIALMDDPNVAELLETWSIEDLRGSVFSGYDTVRSKGRLVTELRSPRPGDVGAPLRALIDETRRLLPEYRQQGSSATVIDNTLIFERRLMLADSMLDALAAVMS
jgi:superfamily I DNA/RNA helicase